MGFYGFAVTSYLNFGGDRGSWVYNRIIIVRCDNVIPENRQDKQLVEHLLEEKEYIVSLAIRCLRQVIKNGYRYSIPTSCRALNEDYQVENNSFLAFMQECVVDRPNPDKIQDKCTTSLFYKVYEAWTRDNNNGYKETKREVKKILNEMGKGDIKKTNGYWYYIAITLNEETKTEYEQIYNADEAEDKPKYKAVNNNPDRDIKELFGDLESMDFNNNELGHIDLHISDEMLDEMDKTLKTMSDNSNGSNNVVVNNNEKV